MEISQSYILSDEQLVTMAQEGSETAVELLMEKYKSLVKFRAKQYFIVGAENEDVVQEGMIGLFKAIRAYDDRKEASFKTFAEQCINNQILSAMKKANRLKHQPLNESLSIRSEVSEGDKDAVLEEAIQDAPVNEPEEQMLLKETVTLLRLDEGGMLSEFERQVLAEKMKGHNYLEIAELFDRSPKSIDNALQRIKKKVLAYLED